MVRAAILAGCMLLARTAAAQDVDYSLDATAAFYGDNTEFFNPFRNSDTLIGASGFIVGEARTSDHLAIRAGVFGNQRFGSADAFEQWRPVISLVIGGPRSRLILGTINSVRRAQGIALEAYLLGSRNVPDRAEPLSIRAGFAIFLRASAEENLWRVHAIIFRGDDFITREGDPHYLSMRLDGSGYRNIRDYAEIGVTKVVPLAGDSWLEASFRGHRVEHDYEYSFRIFAVAKLRID